jgi:hypothetical protein
MHALVDHDPKKAASQEVRDPTLPADTDAIVRVDTLSRCDEAVGTVEKNWKSRQDDRSR